MKKAAIDRSVHHFARAKDALRRLEAATSRDEFEHAWSDFIHEAGRVYAKLKAGASGCNASIPWFGRKTNERCKDPLMQYLHHARNCDEHGLTCVVEETGTSFIAQMSSEETEIHVAFELKVDANGVPRIRNVETKTPKAFKDIRLEGKRMELATVVDKGVTFDPPTMHLGRPITFNSPVKVAFLAAEYLERLIEDARTLPRH